MRAMLTVFQSTPLRKRRLRRPPPPRKYHKSTFTVKVTRILGSIISCATISAHAGERWLASAYVYHSA